MTAFGKATHAVLMIGLLAIGGMIGWWWMDNDLPYTYIKGTIRPDPAREGGRVLLVWDIQPPNRLCPGVVQRTLSDNRTGRTLAIYDPTPSSLTVKAGDTEIRKSFIMPDDMLPNVNLDPGDVEVRYEAKVCFRCNPLQYVMTDRLCTVPPPVIFSVRRNLIPN